MSLPNLKTKEEIKNVHGKGARNFARKVPLDWIKKGNLLLSLTLLFQFEFMMNVPYCGHVWVEVQAQGPTFGVFFLFNIEEGRVSEFDYQHLFKAIINGNFRLVD